VTDELIGSSYGITEVLHQHLNGGTGQVKTRNQRLHAAYTKTKDNLNEFTSTKET
jgi:hypothetical protein